MIGIIAPLALGISLAAAPRSASAEPRAGKPRAQPLGRAMPAVLRVVGEDFDRLREALEARLPSVTVLPHRSESLAALKGREFVYLELSAFSTPGKFRLVVILHDGRYYERNVEVDETDRVRSIASMMANTLAAIREERIEPTGTDRAIPEATDDGGAAAPVAPKQAPPPAREERDAPIRRYELGVLPSGAMLVGLRARDVSGPAGGAGLALDLRLPVGAIVGVGARHATRGNADARLHRVAIDVVGGYSWRRGAYELRTVVGFVVEPWLVEARGAEQHPRTASGARPGPLLGAVLGLSQGWLWRARPEAKTAIRLGMRAQLQAGGLVRGGIGRIRVVRDDVIQELARIGGVELSLGVDAQLWFTLRSTRATRGARPRGRAHSNPSSPPSSSPSSSLPPSSS